MTALLSRIVTVLLVLLFVASCSSNKESAKIPYAPDLRLEGAAKYERAFDVKNSPYYKLVDFYNKKSTGSLILIENFKTIQQVTEVTCGPACALMVLEHFGKRNGYSEKQLQELRGTTQDTTYLRHLITVFDMIGGFKYKSTYDYQKANQETISETFFLEYLKQGIPVIVGTNVWGGHWQIIIGYDTMGTSTTADDVLILADPYDTTDHNQDGYITFSLQHFYYGTWRNYYDPDFDWGLFVAAYPVDYDFKKK
ncbi:MAG: hypothetical protein EZS26_003497 [Candidatus Ordinivivax streblomastigis]|uniref:Peptidase C39-like domain-containing protein n=1 Tax=Candidatus Ordinivivax streblomastigis TaxID=2540710 RepID=A0A5M8NY86_9BACT|nr:MAG: hypothetical protein EZS26_003497 [Candidatus Ordinivivax streblomastigis]